MLQQHGGGDGIDISLASARGPAHLADGAKSGCGSEPLVNETHRKAGSFPELGRNVTNLGGAWSVVAVLVEWETDDKSFSFELRAAANHFRNWRTLSGAASDEACGGGDCPSWIAHREADATVTVVDS